MVEHFEELVRRGKHLQYMMLLHKQITDAWKYVFTLHVYLELENVQFCVNLYARRCQPAS